MMRILSGLFCFGVFILLPLMTANPVLAQASADFSAAGGGGLVLGYDSRTCDGTTAGALRYNSSSSCTEYCNGTGWTCPDPSSVPTVDYLGGHTQLDNFTTYTFEDMFLGREDVSRVVVVAISGGQTASRSISSVSVGGQPASQIVFDDDDFTTFASLWSVNLASGTNGDVVVNWSGSMLRTHIEMYALYNVSGASASDFASANGTQSLNLQIDIPENGVVIALNNTYHPFPNNFTSWTNLTENTDKEVEVSTSFVSSASDAFTSSQTNYSITAQRDFWQTSTDNVLVAASWGP